MKKYIEDTLNYYNDSCKTYYNTWNIEFVNDYSFECPDIFLSYLKPNAHILDLGCGSGRDSLYFKKLHYQVTALDGSIEMCNLSSKLLNQKVEHINFLDLKYEEEFDSIFACASLLHLNNEDLVECLKKLEKALKENGILLASFKYGVGERMKENRYFNDMTENKFCSICQNVPNLKILKSWVDTSYNNHKQFIIFILKKEHLKLESLKQYQEKIEYLNPKEIKKCVTK